MALKNKYNILHLTDLHIFEDEQGRLHNVNTRKSFEAVLAQISQDGIEPDCLLLTGDLSHDEKLGGYNYLFKKITDQFDCPICSIPGNHDQVSLIDPLLADMGRENHRTLPIGNFQIILLNSQLLGSESGELASTELSFLEQTLEESSAEHIIICLHHHVYPMGSMWLDRLKLQNSDDLLQILFLDDRIRLVICGHVHQDNSQAHDGITYLSTAATCFQFKPLCGAFELDTLMPGYRWLELEESGEFSTQVRRIEYRPEWDPYSI